MAESVRLWFEEIQDSTKELELAFEKLEAQLAKHGGHTAECRARNPQKLPLTVDPECDCGWQAIEANDA